MLYSSWISESAAENVTKSRNSHLHGLREDFSKVRHEFTFNCLVCAQKSQGLTSSVFQSTWNGEQNSPSLNLWPSLCAMTS